ncbi:hypothetical protein K6T82_22720 [Flavobacterium sp. 17A]|uniref:Uncharacterized protein n=1 Tax=Flavobacterium potami TaxID=2872310 RepID=A0A9X1HE15_9FLAO|nr:hypothetical protein [Flavobacterium potami]MBZ4037593.1 hypothetical protein [Flavobacterium potami]
MEEALKWGICILLVYFLLHNGFDIQVSTKIRYVFDTVNDTISVKSPLYSEKQIMKISEAVIFVQSEMGSWHYALGAKKSQFVKNHRISEFFGSGKKSNRRQDEYEKEVLAKIDKLIEAVYLKRSN